MPDILSGLIWVQPVLKVISRQYRQAELNCLSVQKVEDLMYFNFSGDHSHLLHSNVSTGKTRSRINEMLGHSVVSNTGLNHTTMSTVPHKKVKLLLTLCY